MLVNITLVPDKDYLCAECDQPGHIRVEAGMTVHSPTPKRLQEQGVFSREHYGPGTLSLCEEHAVQLAKQLADMAFERRWPR